MILFYCFVLNNHWQFPPSRYEVACVSLILRYCTSLKLSNLSEHLWLSRLKLWRLSFKLGLCLSVFIINVHLIMCWNLLSSRLLVQANRYLGRRWQASREPADRQISYLIKIILIRYYSDDQKKDKQDQKFQPLYIAT